MMTLLRINSSLSDPTAPRAASPMRFVAGWRAATADARHRRATSRATRCRTSTAERFAAFAAKPGVAHARAAARSSPTPTR